MMKQYTVSIEINGQQLRVGQITGTGSSDARFSYDTEYLGSEGAAPISNNLPLQREAFSAETTRIFFEGLLPEGFTRRSVMQMLHADSTDYLKVLSALGAECLGAIQITDPETAVPPPSYQELSSDRLLALAEEGASASSELVVQAHLSLTGASGKVGLYLDKSGKWYLPSGTAPSTHIVKQSHVRLEQIVCNEQLCMKTASLLGVKVPESFILRMGRNDHSSHLFAAKRYDRIMAEEPRLISGLPCPLRLHQEDFAQALGIPAEEKYETPGGQHLTKMFDLIRSCSGNPVEDQFLLWDMIVFDYLAGNTDNHIKNYSLLYSRDLRTVRLAPAYDMLSTTVYESSTRDMAFAIGGCRNLHEIDRAAFGRASGEAGLGRKAALDRFDHMAEHFSEALDQAAEQLTQEGFHQAETIKTRILRSGGIARV